MYTLTEKDENNDLNPMNLKFTFTKLFPCLQRFLSSADKNVTACKELCTPSYCVYILQPIRFTRVCSNVSDNNKRNQFLTAKTGLSIS